MGKGRSLLMAVPTYYGSMDTVPLIRHEFHGD
jgi:hypothetical protein